MKTARGSSVRLHAAAFVFVSALCAFVFVCVFVFAFALVFVCSLFACASVFVCFSPSSSSAAKWLAKVERKRIEDSESNRVPRWSGRELGTDRGTGCAPRQKMTPAGFEPTPFRNGALSHRRRPLAQSVLGVLCKAVLLLVSRRKCSPHSPPNVGLQDFHAAARRRRYSLGE
jgi:hypothetical protein